MVVTLLAAIATGCATTQAQVPRDLRVVSFNVMRGAMVAVERKPLLRHVVPARATFPAVLRDHPLVAGMQVLALQELCSDRDGAHIRYFERIVAGSARPWTVFARNDEARDGACREGVALISRLPIVASGSIRLPAVRMPERHALWADVRVTGAAGDHIVRVYNVHLHHSADAEPGPVGRARQLAVVLEHYREWRRLHPLAGVILLGDFNTREDVEPALADAAALLDSALPRAQATHWLRWPLDHVYFRGLGLVSGRVVRTGASDHFVVAADFDLE